MLSAPPRFPRAGDQDRKIYDVIQTNYVYNTDSQLAQKRNRKRLVISGEKPMKLASEGTVIIVSDQYLVIRRRLWARLIVAVLLWPILTLALVPALLWWELLPVGILVSAILFLLYVVGCLRIRYAICVDRRKGTVKIPWPYQDELLFPLVVKTYPAADVKVERRLQIDSDVHSDGCYWQVLIVLPRGRRVVVFLSTKTDLSQTVEETLTSFTRGSSGDTHP